MGSRVQFHKFEAYGEDDVDWTTISNNWKYLIIAMEFYFVPNFIQHFSSVAITCSAMNALLQIP